MCSTMQHVCAQARHDTFEHVYLAALCLLAVQGTLEFDRTDLHLAANYIFVMEGAFIVGTEADPFLQSAIITLKGAGVRLRHRHLTPQSLRLIWLYARAAARLN